MMDPEEKSLVRIAEFVGEMLRSIGVWVFAAHAGMLNITIDTALLKRNFEGR